MNYLDRSIDDLHALLVSKSLTSQQLVQDTVENIKAVDPELKAFIRLNENAENEAEAIDNQGIDADNVLAGIPIAIKDNILTKNLITTAASKILDNFNPIYDATVIEKLKAAGMITIGKTNLDEFAMGSSTENSAMQITKNAWDANHVPGGSSGGSASAVGAGEIVASLGSDTGGSIRQPASFNGVVGFKPTYGRVSRWGLIAFSSSLDQIGVMTRNVEDNARVMAAISGADPKDSTSVDMPVDYLDKINDDIKGMRIGIPSEYFGSGVDEGVKAKINEAIETMKSLGAIVDEVSLPHSKYAVPTYYIIASSEASSNLQRFDGIRYGYRAPEAKTLDEVYVETRTQGFGDEVKRRIMLGTYSLSAGYYDAYFNQAAKVRTLIRQDFDNVFKDHDLILAPTTPTTAFEIGTKISDPVTMYMNDVLTIPVNLAGLPAASIPAGLSDGLPVGMQLIGNRFDEKTIYQAANAFEKATKFTDLKPNVKGAN